MPSDGLTFGKVPMPAYTNRLIPDSLNWAWDNLGARRLYGVVQHTMVTGLWSCDSYFRSGSAAGLTDFGIGGATDGADDGRILMWNDPTGKGYSNPKISANRWPWASGPVNGPNGDAPQFINKYGPNAVNGYLVSIERSDGGDPNIGPSEKYIESFTKLTAYYADQGKIPYDQYPYNPNTDCWSYFWHSEINSGKTCPAGAKPATDEIQQEVIKILKQYQTAGSEEEDPLADLPKSAYTLNPDLIWQPDASTGAVGQLWRDYGEKTGIFNPPGQPWNDADGSYTLYQFEGGPLIAKDQNGKVGIVVKVKQ